MILTLSSFQVLANPDLWVQAVQARSADIPPPFAGGAVEVDFLVLNIGNQTAFNFWINAYSGQSSSCSGPLILEDSAFIQSIPAGGGVSGTFLLHSRSGDDRIFGIVKADATNAVIENNENNNCKASFAVTVRYSDLRIVSTLGPHPNQILAGGDGASLLTSVTNFGTTGFGWPADASNVRYFLSTAPSNPPASDILPFQGFTPPLGINEQTDVPMLIEADESVPLGVYNLFAKADGDNQIIEGQENNNFSPALPLEIVDICTLADIDDDGLVTILDLVSIVNGTVSFTTSENRHLDLRRSPFPFPQLVNRTDLIGALPCFGSFEFDSEMGGSLESFSVQPAMGGGFEVAVQTTGYVSAVEVYVKSPLGFPLTAAYAYDVLGSNYTHALTDSDGSRVLANEYKTTGNTTTQAGGEWIVARVDAPGIDLSQTEPLSDPLHFTSGVAVSVLFGDGTQQNLVRRFTYADVPDPAFRNHVEGELGLASGAPISDMQAASITSLNLDNLGIDNLQGIHRFTNLTSLFCQYNQLNQLPDLSDLTQLHTLAAAHNQLKFLPALPPNLQLLWVGNNQLIKLPDLSAMTGLISLSCPANQITQLPALASLTQLQQLNCYQNRISDLPVLPNSVTILLASNNLLVTCPNMSGNQFDLCDLANNYLTDLYPLTQVNWPPGAALYLENNNLDYTDCANFKTLGLQVANLDTSPQRLYPEMPCETGERSRSR